MTLHNPCDHDENGKRDKHFGMLTTRWEGLLERGNLVVVCLNGGHRIQGRLRQDKKGYFVWHRIKHSAIYIELGDVVAVEEFIPEFPSDPVGEGNG